MMLVAYSPSQHFLMMIPCHSAFAGSSQQPHPDACLPVTFQELIRETKKKIILRMGACAVYMMMIQDQSFPQVLILAVEIRSLLILHRMPYAHEFRGISSPNVWR